MRPDTPVSEHLQQGRSLKNGKTSTTGSGEATRIIKSNKIQAYKVNRGNPNITLRYRLSEQ